jgi:hypothetical protein
MAPDWIVPLLRAAVPEPNLLSVPPASDGGRTNPEGKTRSNQPGALGLTLSVLLIAVACEVNTSTPPSRVPDSSPSLEGTRLCPIQRVPRVRPDVRGVAFAYGEGPVFVGLGTGDGRIRYTEDAREDDGWFYNKTLWAIAPGYTGVVVITGGQIDGPTRLRFNPAAGFPGEKRLELRFPNETERRWRYGPSETLIRAPGCYAFQVRGDNFNRTIVFKAVR